MFNSFSEILSQLTVPIYNRSSAHDIFEFSEKIEIPFSLSLKDFNSFYEIALYVLKYPEEVLEKYFDSLEKASKKSQNCVRDLRKALELRSQFEQIEAEDVHAIDHWRDFIAFLDDENLLVRALAAKNLGSLYSGDAQVIVEDLPDFIDMIRKIGKKEKKTAGVLGPFIDGYDSELGIAGLNYFKLKKNDFDAKNFILDVLVESLSEPYFPGIQSLEFYAHEYFDRDVESLQKLLKAGKDEIVLEALMCGSSKLEGRRELIEKLCRSRYGNIAESAKRLLYNASTKE